MNGMEINSGIIIDGVLHELCYGACADCSLRNECDNRLDLICDTFHIYPNTDLCFVSRGKVTDIKTEEDKK